jgi:hypothetical protein
MHRSTSFVVGFPGFSLIAQATRGHFAASDMGVCIGGRHSLPKPLAAVHTHIQSFMSCGLEQ